MRKLIGGGFDWISLSHRLRSLGILFVLECGASEVNQGRARRWHSERA